MNEAATEEAIVKTTKKKVTKPKVSAPVDVTDDVAVRPFYKFIGGKTGSLPELRKHVPETFAAYHEPMLGGGALFWDLVSSRRLRKGYVALSDNNPIFTRVFRAVKNDVEGVIAGLKKQPVTEKHYYKVRGTSPDDRAAMSDVELAVWFIYTNKSGYNGMFRVTKAGVFNVPWCGYDRYPKKSPPTVCDEPLLRACSAALQNLRVSVNTRPFEEVLHYAKKGDLAYFDPPYYPTSPTADFTSYTKEGFRHDDHVRLRDVARELKERGVFVMLSNSDVPAVRELYEDFSIEVVQVRRSVNSKADGRGSVRELLIR